MRRGLARSIPRSVARLALVGLLAVVVVACSDYDSSSDSGSSDPTSSTSSGGSSSSTSSSTKPAKAMDLTTPAFGDGETIPVEYTCSGAGTAPELRWSEPPTGTEQIAVIVFDPDARAGEGFVHYVGWGIDPAARELTADGYAQATLGANGTGAPGWIPPCPPPGDEPHRYEFRIYALSGAPSVPAGTDMVAFQEATRDQILSQATVIGSFSR